MGIDLPQPRKSMARGARTTLLATRSGQCQRDPVFDASRAVSAKIESRLLNIDAGSNFIMGDSKTVNRGRDDRASKPSHCNLTLEPI